MCYIAYGKVKKIRSLPIKGLWLDNPDGAGIWCNGRVFKGILTLDNLIACLKQLDPGAQAILHLRLATTGPKSPQMTHPFRIGNSNQYLFHNGVLSHLGSKEESDTAHLARLLANLDQSEWMGILNSLSGRFIVANCTKVELAGYWHDWKELKVSRLPSLFVANNTRLQEALAPTRYTRSAHNGAYGYWKDNRYYAYRGSTWDDK